MRFICRMMDGRSRRTMDFIDLVEGASEKSQVKTLLRDLQGLTTVPELQIVTWKHQGTSYWRMNAKLTPDPVTKIKEKYCPKCDKTKPIEEFYLQRGTADGRKSACSDCTKKHKREWAKANRKHINAYRRRKYKNKSSAEKARNRRTGAAAKPLFQPGDTDADYRAVPRGRQVPADGTRADEDGEDSKKNTRRPVRQDHFQ